MTEVEPQREEAVPESPKVAELKKEAQGHKGLKLTMGLFKNLPMLVQAIRKVYNCTNFPNFKSSYRIKKLVEHLEIEMKKYQQLMSELPKPEEKEARDKKIEELHAMEFSLKWDAITEAELNCIQGLSPADIAELEPIIDPKALS